MLTIKTRVKPSSIKGAGEGLYTTESLVKGQVIWKRDITDIVVVENEFNQLQEMELEGWVEKYGTVDEDGNWFIDNDDCKYCNHSLTPNIVFLESVGVALENMSPNTELVCDYYTITDKKHADKILNNQTP